MRDCLAWPTEEVTAEKYVDADYIDYVLGHPPLALIEAKREGVYFELPDRAWAGWSPENVAFDWFARSREMETQIETIARSRT